MPLFEYACRSCARSFEYLTRADQTPTCPSCGGADLEKQLSTFAVSAAPLQRGAARLPRGAAGSRDSIAAAGPGACGMCGDPRGPGSCSVN